MWNFVVLFFILYHPSADATQIAFSACSQTFLGKCFLEISKKLAIRTLLYLWDAVYL